MPEPDTTVTTDKPSTDEAPADPGMAAFLADKKDKEATTEKAETSEEKVEDKTEAEKPAGDKPAEETKTEAKGEEVTPVKTEAGDDSTAEQNQNRLGYQLRQIRAGDPFVARARKALTDDYVNEAGITDDQREIRQMKADRYLETLETKRAQLVADNQQVAEEYSFFRPLNPDGTKNPEFNEALYKRAVDRFGRDSLEMSEPDENGKQEIVGYKVRLLDYMREEADLWLAGRGETKGKTDPKKPDEKVETPKKDDAKTQAEMDAASEEVGGASTTKSEAQAEEKDPMVKAFLAGFDSA